MPQEVREYARVAHAFIDAFGVSMDLLVIDRTGRHHAGRLTASNFHQDPSAFPPSFAGEFTLVDNRGRQQTFDILDVQDVFPLFTPEQAAAQVPEQE